MITLHVMDRTGYDIAIIRGPIADVIAMVEAIYGLELFRWRIRV